MPHVIEPSLGVDRTLLAVLTAAYTEDEVPNDKGKLEKRTLLKFSPRVAPYKAAIFPLLKNKPELVEVADKLYKKLQRRWNVFYDASGAIGRRYRRQDEIGTPFGITIDFDTIEKDGTVTLRDRDTCEQRRVSEASSSPSWKSRSKVRTDFHPLKSHPSVWTRMPSASAVASLLFSFSALPPVLRSSESIPVRPAQTVFDRVPR